MIEDNGYPCGDNVLSLAMAMMENDAESAKMLHWVLFYESEYNANVPPYRVNVFVRQKPPRRFSDLTQAMDCYSNTPCPASQIIHGNSVEEMESLTEERDRMMADEDWVEENLEPLL